VSLAREAGLAVGRLPPYPPGVGASTGWGMARMAGHVRLTMVINYLRLVGLLIRRGV
jgi:hypothetical protein